MAKVTPNKSIEIFFSYSHADEELRQKLANHLSNLQRNGHITAWHDREISAGTVSADEIEKHLNSADVILLLISADFIASEDSWQREVTRAMEKHEAKEARVIPVLVRDCDWEETPFSRLQPLPSNRKAINSWDNKDAAFTDVAKGIRKAVKEISGQKKSDSKNQWLSKIPWGSLFTTFWTSTSISTLVVVVRLLGFLQPLELAAYDQLMVSQWPNEEPDNRLLLIQVTEQDIKELEEQKGVRNGSLTDASLKKLFEKLMENPPRVIGLDIYRDYETRDDIPKKLFKENKILFAVCKLSDPAIGVLGRTPPPEIAQERIGFSDFLEDKDRIFRRQLLVMEPNINSGCLSKKAFSLQLAHNYLITEGKEQYQDPESEGKLQDLRLNNVVLEQLKKPDTGGYQDIDDMGYQVLLNYRSFCDNGQQLRCSPHNIAEKLTLKQVFNEDSLKKIKNLNKRIVLIGVTDPSYEVPFATPFNTTESLKMPGVIIQAHTVSQILRAVLDKQLLLRVWSFWYEILWIFAWSLVGAILAHLCRSTRSLIIFGVTAFIGLCLVCLIFFVSPIKRWIPFIPPALTLLGTGGIVVFIRFKAQKYS